MRLSTLIPCVIVGGFLAACAEAPSPLAPDSTAKLQADAPAATVSAQAKGPVPKVVVCHVPPGNPDNAHEITVGAPAVPAHLAHGDELDGCGGDDDDDDGPV